MRKWDPEAMRVAGLWKMRASIFVGACMAHTMGAVLVLAAQTSCLDVPCFDSWFFDALRRILMFPLFLTPWLDFPPQDVPYVQDLPLVAWFVPNAVAACVLSIVAWVAGRYARAWWVARRALKKAVV
jgi:hypothetical protein